MFDRFTDRARRVIALARDQARELNHDRVGTEHLLLGLVCQRDTLAAKVLSSLGMNDAAVREHIEGAADQGQRAAAGAIPFTGSAKLALQLSLREALEHGAADIAPEHILLGVMRAGDSKGARLLAQLGADLDGVRQRVNELKVAAASHRGPRESAEMRARIVANRRVASEAWTAAEPASGEVGRQQDSRIARLRRDMEAAAQRGDFEAAAALLETERRLLADLLAGTRARQAGPTLADQVRNLRQEVARLRGIMREHGIEADGADEV